MSEPSEVFARLRDLAERNDSYGCIVAVSPDEARLLLAARTAAGEESDFLAFMADELDRFPCLHGPAGNGAHAKTPLMMWPELIRCIVAKAKQDAHPATDAPPPVPAEVVAADIWTDDECFRLNAAQHDHSLHGYTCGNDSRHRPLIATRQGWRCADCDYRQGWAHGVARHVLRAGEAASGPA